MKKRSGNKVTFLQTFQVSLLNLDGSLRWSDDQIFSTADLQGENILDAFPIIHSLIGQFASFSAQDEQVLLQKVEITNHDYLPDGFYDYEFRFTTLETEPCVLWYVYDYTFFYGEYLKKQQFYNEQRLLDDSLEDEY